MPTKKPLMTDEELKIFCESSIENLQPKIDSLTDNEKIRMEYPGYEKGLLEGMQTAYKTVLIKKGLWKK